MHFSKTYAQLLVTLPPEFRNNPFEYRKLKQLINQTASELDSLGLGPSVLRSLHEQGHGFEDDSGSDDSHGSDLKSADSESTPSSDASHKPAIIYEIILNSFVPEPRLRLSMGAHDHSAATPIYHVDLHIPDHSLRRITQMLLHPPLVVADEIKLLESPTESAPNQLPSSSSDPFSDQVIPLPSDVAFFQLLTSSLSSLSGHLDALQDHFRSDLAALATSISSTARPASYTAPRSFSAYSITADNAMSLRPSPGGKSDLYIWREIFRLYAEVEVFESIRESKRGERSIEDAEKHLKLFQARIHDKKSSLVLAGSRDAFDVFLNLNTFIIDVKKFQLANSEATRKILKKHAKRTTFPIPSYLLERDASVSTPSHQVTLISRPSKSLPRLLVQAIGEVLLPVVPHIDDYMCLICTSIAFKPIRLGCGHFFCVRCLVKMQKRGMANCPMCRATTVLSANPSNIDYGLLNFMADWFPIESLEKLRANEREINREQLEVLGIADVPTCRIM